MNIVDSSGWLDYFSDGPNADQFAHPIQEIEQLIVPSITLFEVFKVVLRERGEDSALQAIALMKQGTEVELTGNLAIQAAKLSFELKLPMADSIIFATAQYYNATIWTQDGDFKNLPNVKYYSA